MDRSRTVGARDALREVTRESGRSDAYGSWIRSRADTLLSAITAQDVLRHFGTTLNRGDDQQEQISCPFHGEDKSPSARVYPGDGTSRSGLYCWVCQKRWDIFGIYKMFHGDEQMKFGEVVRGLERAFGITPPEMSTDNWEAEDSGPSDREQGVLDLLETCERRLKQGKAKFTLSGFMTVGKLLDHLHFSMRAKDMELAQIEGRAKLILDKIGEKIRSA
jgi:hypothetical protein